MFKNYLLIALRNLKKNLSYVLINTFGLGIALACCITAYVLLAYNIEFDHFHDDEKVSNVYSVHSHFMGKEGQSVPVMSYEWVTTISQRYIELYEKVIGDKFVPQELSENETFERITVALNEN